MPGPTKVTVGTPNKQAKAAVAPIKLGAAAKPVNAQDHGKLCECVDCWESNREHTRDISCPEVRCKKTVRIHVDISCEATRLVTDKWSYELDGQKCEDIEPEPLPCEEDDIRVAQ